MRASPALRWSGRACRACPRASPPDPPGCDHPWMRTLRQCAFRRPRPKHGPAILRSKQPVCRPLHLHDILGMGPDAAKDAEHRLHEERRTHQATLEKMREVVEVTDVVALKLEAGVAVVAGRQNVFDVLERIAEDEIARSLQMLPLPIELELLVAPQQMVEPEVDGSHVERGDFRLELRRRPHTLLDLHVGTAAGGQIDHGAAALLQARQEFPEARRRLIWSSGLWVTGG